MIRIFSMTLPGHENGLPAKEAMKVWADDISHGRDCVGQFLDAAQLAVDFAVKEKFADPGKLATGGLSRGGFIAAHLAARDARFRHILGYAPLTRLAKLKEFAHMRDNPLANSLDLTHLAEKLSDRHIRLYIGNEDTRVGTEECVEFAMSLVKHKKTRVAQVELFLFPSVGQMGHGTPPEIFKQGVDWITTNLKV
jgi:predicted esterase